MREIDVTLTRILIEAVLHIDQAIGNLEIILQEIQRDPRLAAPGVDVALASAIKKLDSIASQVEKMRKKVM